jgi:hypothetical protein
VTAALAVACGVAARILAGLVVNIPMPATNTMQNSCLYREI